MSVGRTHSDLSRLPITVNSDPALRAIFIWSVFSFLPGGPIYALTAAMGYTLLTGETVLQDDVGFTDGDTLALIIPCGIGYLLCVAAVVHGLVTRRKTRRTYVIDADSVRCGNGRGELWSEPVENYSGVLWYEEMRGSGRYRTGPFQVLYLQHPDPNRRFLLAEVAAIKVKKVDPVQHALQTWRSVANLLNLPTIQIADGEMTYGAAADADETPREEATAGTADVAFDTTAKPPWGATWKREDGRLTAIVWITWFPLFLGTFMSAASTFVVAVGIREGDAELSIVFGIIACLFAFIALLPFVTRKHLIVTGDEVGGVTHIFGLPFMRRAVARQDVDLVKVIEDGGLASGVFIGGNDGFRVTWLAKRSAEWLAEFAEAAMNGALGSGKN